MPWRERSVNFRRETASGRCWRVDRSYDARNFTGILRGHLQSFRHWQGGRDHMVKHVRRARWRETVTSESMEAEDEIPASE